KLDREALPTPEQQGTGPDHISPRDPVEELLATLCAEALGIDPTQVGVYDDFFELGGHSLLVTRLIARVRGVLGASLTPRDVFEHSTVAGLAYLVRECHGTTPLPRIRRADRAASASLSPGQERLWFLEQLQPGTATYTIPLVYRLRGVVDVAALRAALADVVDRHEVLR
ncbi:phosphopantetheine-binding protein, partial [Streptosporangium algeriense]